MGVVNLSDLRDVLRAPGLISLSRLPLAVAFPFIESRPSLAVSVLAAAGASDLADGWVARRRHEETEAGATVDGVMDKVFVLTVVATLIARRRLPPPAAALLCARELAEVPIFLGVCARGEPGGVKARRSNAAGKIATAVQFAALSALLARSRHANALVLAAGLAGAVAAFTYFARELPEARTMQFTRPERPTKPTH
jgi:CDP-diacylglycerol--glycerol-3-phosphate 3-phosphatidyltransferase/cardiolipin synthase